MSGCEDSVEIVRALFGAFADRDLVRARQLCHPDLVLRPLATSKRADRPDAYRGRDGLDQYFRDVEDVWEQLRLAPTAFWQTNGSVIVFGQVIARVNGMTRKADTLWVYRLRDGLIASVDVFRQPDLQKAPITAG
jgi:ketosteroid isomerase-like protein